jgi:pyruvate/2-oxoglutarate dehydrogenase complex dihydrolipoamide dehydrogenase (E3) component
MEGRIAATNAVLGPTRQASYEVVPGGSFTDPEYGRVGLTETEAAAHHDVIVGTARYDDLLRPVADGRSEGFCKLIADRQTRAILGAHVLGEYSAETVQTVAACMAAGMTIEHVAGAPARVPDLHRSRRHGRAEDLPVPGHRKLPAGLELSRRGGLTNRRPAITLVQFL